ncbi:DUF6225 family protein [Streptomyces sp. NPDC046976]|uniref:DUF6225 family protein n=1 Tax=Streptomyces sp. NPDC046976 TaxID=3155258 RepID=UPI0033E2134A
MKEELMSTHRIGADGYHHAVEAWTAGRLRAALDGVPDETIVAGSIPMSLAPRPTDPAGGEDDDWVMIDLEESPSALSEPMVLVFDRPTGRYICIHRQEEGEEMTD